MTASEKTFLKSLAAIYLWWMTPEEALKRPERIAIQVMNILKALVYFEGGDLDMLPTDERALLVSAVKNVKSLPACTLLSLELVS